MDESFQNISLYDYDPLVNWDAYNLYGYYDWIHFNAIAYTEGVLYVSSRHLDRITKIDYTSKNIIPTLYLFILLEQVSMHQVFIHKKIQHVCN